MNKYAQITVKAVEYLKKGLDAENAWETASYEYYEKGSPSQMKACPKGAFLGLFSDHPKRTMGKNAMYALKAVEVLRSNPTHKYTKKELWSSVTKNKNIIHNNQMDVVLALWDNQLIPHSKSQ